MKLALGTLLSLQRQPVGGGVCYQLAAKVMEQASCGGNLRCVVSAAPDQIMG